jgi:hypothetical protein
VRATCRMDNMSLDLNVFPFLTRGA